MRTAEILEALSNSNLLPTKSAENYGTKGGLNAGSMEISIEDKALYCSGRFSGILALLLRRDFSTAPIM
jgi:hypothetical protein